MDARPLLDVAIEAIQRVFELPNLTPEDIEFCSKELRAEVDQRAEEAGE